MNPKIIELRPLGTWKTVLPLQREHNFHKIKVIRKSFQNDLQKPPKMEPPGTPNHIKSRKNEYSKKHWKTALRKVGSWSHFDPKKGLVFRGANVSKTELWPQNVPQASRRGSQGPKIPKNHEKCLAATTFFMKNGSLCQARISSSSNSFLKMRHGGGLCAQRTGYMWSDAIPDFGYPHVN